MKRWAPAVIGICAATVAAADYDPSQYPAYETCALCHGLFGVSHTHKFPHLAGQRPAYIEAQLRAFLAGERENDGGQMVAIVTELHELDIPLVMEWFSGQEPPDASDSPEDDTGATLFADLGCGTCHANTADLSGAVPYLTAQHAGYLIKQMKDFAEGRRTHSEVATMHADLLSPVAESIDDIADYLASVSRTQ